MELFVQILAEVFTGASFSSNDSLVERLLIAAVVAGGAICILVLVAAGSAAGS
jgi:hypothetical protein